MVKIVWENFEGRVEVYKIESLTARSLFKTASFPHVMLHFMLHAVLYAMLYIMLDTMLDAIRAWILPEYCMNTFLNTSYVLPEYFLNTA